MRRREFLCLLGGATSWPFKLLAQTVNMPRLAVLTPSQTQWQPQVFYTALGQLGYREGVNLSIDVASADGKLERLSSLAERVVATKPDVIVAVNFPGTQAAAKATDRIPIVSAALGDPVLLGFVKNIARPEGNITGVANLASDITSKRIALLKEIVPDARRIALFLHPDEPIVAPQLRDIEASARALDIEFRPFPMRTTIDLQQGLRLASEWKAHAIARLAGQGFALGAETGRLATEFGLPSMLLQKSDVEAGGLMSYFADHRHLWEKVATYVSRLLKGTSPRELPFELPTRFELVLNLRTAKILKLTVPPTLLARADEVIE